MKKIGIVLCILIGVAGNAAELSDFAGEQVKKAVPGTITLQGPDGWLYSRNELEHLSRGELAAGKAAKASVALKNPDPIPAIQAFNDALKAAGIRLILVPVPPKFAVYPFGGWKPGDAAKYLKPFYAELRARGITVVDLTDDFLAARDRNVYCKTDAHWSPAGILLAARKLKEVIGMEGKTPFRTEDKTLRISGDLAVSLNAKAPASESVTVREVKGNAFDENSPVLLLGDSHILIFSNGADMLAKDAGLGEQLACELKMPVDRIGVKGSASSIVRINLYRKASRNAEWLKNKKVILWILTCREFTESSNGWMPVPVFKGSGANSGTP
ncbi:MAG: hypothetical protein BWY31_04077 [Lentisphaerae bacterium ADurb.Bin242]|nr:MAG: hypothetical protein BWY31_04077 [Lentisphaerae bacterium ADurb.Bin242]